jgi:hypothetical protein
LEPEYVSQESLCSKTKLKSSKSMVDGRYCFPTRSRNFWTHGLGLQYMCVGRTLERVYPAWSH